MEIFSLFEKENNKNDRERLAKKEKKSQNSDGRSAEKTQNMTQKATIFVQKNTGKIEGEIEKIAGKISEKRIRRKSWFCRGVTVSDELDEPGLGPSKYQSTEPGIFFTLPKPLKITHSFSDYQ